MPDLIAYAVAGIGIGIGLVMGTFMIRLIRRYMRENGEGK